MVERLTSTATNKLLLQHVNNNLSTYNDLTVKLSSGDKITNISEDPTAAVNILNTNRQINQIATFKGNIAMNTEALNAQDSVFSLAEKYSQRGYDLALQASNETYERDSLVGIKSDIDELIKTMVDLSNTQYNGEYIFSGTRTKTTTYKTTKDEEGNITVEYNGSQADTNYQRKTEVSLGVFEPVNITGEHVFGYHEKIQSVDANGNKLFTDKDGNEVYLDETTKQYFYTNPVDPANPEYQGETSDLTKQYKQAEDAAGNKKFEAEDGEYVYFDGANYLDEEGNAYTGDTSNLKKVYEYNSAGIFGALCELSSSLGRTINSAEHGNSEIQNIAQGEIRATLDKFETGMNNITTLQTKFGGVMNRLEMTSNTLDTNELNLKEYVSNLKDIDYTTAITEWLTAQYAYQASLTATSQSMNLSLLNYM